MSKQKEPTNPAVTPVFGPPVDAEELVTKYGTYEVQDTCDTDNTYPLIAQGLPDPLGALLRPKKGADKKDGDRAE